MQKQKWVSIDKFLSYILLLIIGLVLGYQTAMNGGKVPFTSWQIPFLAKQSSTYYGQIDKSQTVNLDLFWRVWSLLDQRYLEPDDLQTDEMVDGAIGGMVSALGDPYTVYLPAETKKISEEDLAGSFAGIGVELGYKDKSLAVMAPLADGPAEKLGVEAGDIIMHVKDEKAEVDEDSYDWTLEKAQSVLRGKKGDKVTVTFFREDYNDGLPFEVEIVRDEIVIKSVELEFVERNGKRYALITLSRFGERTPDEWNAIVTQVVAQKQDVAGVILDLRNNPGGFFSEAIHVASEFIPKGEVVVTQKGKYSSQAYTSIGNGRLIGWPLIVLTNQGSASSSEIVAGALRDQLGTKLVGEKTFGKGLVQERVDLNNGAGLNVTIAKWVMPDGDWIQEEGIEVDVEAEDDAETTEVDEVVETAIQNF